MFFKNRLFEGGTATTQIPINGTIAQGFELVRDKFQRNFSERGELGAAFAVYHRGEKVVDLCGGIRNQETGELWEEDTMVLVFS
jgi:CubicO group peptidase (beta-lactamase class C family)